MPFREISRGEAETIYEDAPPDRPVVDTKVPARTPAKLRSMMVEAEAAMKTVVDSVAHLPVPDPAKPSFDRNAYHRAYMKAYMRKRRAAAKGER